MVVNFVQEMILQLLTPEQNVYTHNNILYGCSFSWNSNICDFMGFYELDYTIQNINSQNCLSFSNHKILNPQK